MKIKLLNKYFSSLRLIAILSFIIWQFFDFNHPDKQKEIKSLDLNNKIQVDTISNLETNSSKLEIIKSEIIHHKKTPPVNNKRRKNRPKRKKSDILPDKIMLLFDESIENDQKKIISLQIANDINTTNDFNMLIKEYDYLSDSDKLQIQSIISKISSAELVKDIYKMSLDTSDEGLINSSISALKNINNEDSKRKLILLIESDNIIDNQTQIDSIKKSLSENINNNDLEWILNDINSDKYTTKQAEIIIDSFLNNRYSETINIMNKIKEKYYYDDLLIEKINHNTIIIEAKTIKRPIVSN